VRDLRDALRALSERGTPVGSEVLRQRVALALAGGGEARLGARRRAAPGWVPAVAFVVTILVVGIPIYLVVRGGGEAVTTTTQLTSTVPPTTSTVAPTTTTVPPTTTTTTMPGPPANLAMNWRRVYSESFVGGALLKGLVATDSGFVAAGGGSIYLSEDGSSWQRSVPGTFGPTGDLRDLAVDSDSRLVVVGSSASRPAVWSSTDGVAWTMVEQDEVVFPAEGELSEVVASEVGWVAVGQQEVGSWAGPAGNFLGIWISPDAVTWERVSGLEDTGAGGVWENAHVTELLAWHGDVYALGYTEGPTSLRETPAVWTSGDGRSWHRVKPENGGKVGNPPGYPEWGAWIEGATATDTALYAVGLEMNWWRAPYFWNLAVWRSEDGATWSLLPTDFQAPGRHPHGLELKGVVADGDRVVAIELCDYVWASGDRGDTWHQVAELENEGVCLPESSGIAWALVFDGDRFVATGQVLGDAAIWVGEWAEG